MSYQRIFIEQFIEFTFETNKKELPQTKIKMLKSQYYQV